MAGSFLAGMAGLAGSLISGIAGSLISGIIDKAKEKLCSPVFDEFGLLWGVKEAFEKLSSQYSAIQSVLEDAEKQQVTSDQVKDWLRKLKDAAYDAEDVLDEFSTEALRSKVASRTQTRKRKWVSDSDFSNLTSQSIAFQREMALKIKEILKRLDEIAVERHNLHLREGDVVRQPEIRYRTPPTISLIEESDVFGREEEKQELVNMLVSDGSSGTEVSVIPVVGMGGLGKTTLAQLVYNDEIVKKQFEIRAWVCVSDAFDLKRLTKEIIESAFKETSNFDQLNSLVEHLQSKLHQKKFLLVLDDVWSEDARNWDVLKVPLRCGAKGSKIIVTTRIQKVADIMGTIPAYRLGVLSDEHGLALFRNRAFANDLHGDHKNLDGIGEKIVKKCKGVPLAVKTLGGLLQTTREANKWNYILECDIWKLQQKENNIIPLLRLSYDCLPSHLKQCFEFCATFPKDYEFEREKLVKMWMGAGFIRSEERKEMEDIGRGYFNDLLWRSFFQYDNNDWKGQPRYKMHDLIHDVAQSVSKEECFRVEDGSTCHFLEKARYSSLFCTKTDQTISESFYECKSLRTFILLRHQNMLSFEPTISLNPDNIFQKLRCMRVLDLSHTRIVELPDSIGELKHLRYLGLSHTSIQRLPDSACRLYNLQTLNLIGCWELCELPKDTRNLINLRHLAVDSYYRLPSMPQGIGILTSLQTLPRFIVGKESGGGIEELKKLNNLRGELRICQLENVVNAKEAELKNKQYIDRLSLEWYHDGDGMRVEEEEVLESLQPHTNLIEFSIYGYCGGTFPAWLLGLSNLKSITFSNCRSCKILPPLGQLPSLENLTIDGMTELSSIGGEFCGDRTVRAFPMLKVLSIWDMPKLEEWCGVEEGDFPRLNKLDVYNCKSLTALPRLLLLSLGELKVGDCDDKMILSSLPYLTSLSSLKIIFRSEVEVVIPSGLIQSLTQLKHLDISECSKLTFLPENGLLPPSPLKRLTISNCDSITSLPSGLQNLEDLQLLGSKLTSSLPEGLKNLSSLKTLILSSCPKLATIPEEGLPTTLQSLSIDRCPLLEERCQKQCGQDWSKISHIPSIVIKGRFIS